MPSTTNHKEPWEIAWEEEILNNHEGWTELMNDHSAPPTDPGTYQQREQRTSRDIAEAWKRGE
jgi:hypothetical protein